MNLLKVSVLKVRHYGTKDKAYIPCIGAKTLGKIWYTKTAALQYARSVLSRYQKLKTEYKRLSKPN